MRNTCLYYCDLPPHPGSRNHSSKHISPSELEILFLKLSWLPGFFFSISKPRIWTSLPEGFYFLRSGGCFLVCILCVCREENFTLLDFLVWRKKGKVHRCPRDGAVSPQSWWTGIPRKEEPEKDPIQTATKPVSWGPGGFPGDTRGKESTCQSRKCERRGFDPWVGRIPWRRAWQPTPVFLPGESHEQRNLVGSTVHRLLKSQTQLKWLSTQHVSLQYVFYQAFFSDVREKFKKNSFYWMTSMTFVHWCNFISWSLNE